jgi:hypothetical protein
MAAVHFGSCASVRRHCLAASWYVFGPLARAFDCIAGFFVFHCTANQCAMTLTRLLFSAPIYPHPQIAISRTLDYRHNFSDVIAGALIGSFAAYASYFCHCTCEHAFHDDWSPMFLTLRHFSHRRSIIVFRLSCRHGCIWQIMRWTRRSATSRFPFWID